MGIWKAKRPGHPGDSVTLRGGRLRKSRRGVLTYAPWLGRLTAVAPLAAATAAVMSGALVLSGDSHAQLNDIKDNACTFIASHGTDYCAGNITVLFTGVAPFRPRASFRVRDAHGPTTGAHAVFNIAKTDSTAILVFIPRPENSTDVDIVLGGPITANRGAAVSAILSYGAVGDIDITLTGAARSIKDEAGDKDATVPPAINLVGNTRTNITLNVNSVYAAEADAIRARTTDGNISITATGDIRGAHDAVEAHIRGGRDDALTLNLGGRVTGFYRTAIFAKTEGGDVDITAGKDIVARGYGIDLEVTRGGSAITIDLDGKVTGRYQDAIQIKTSGFRVGGNDISITADGDIVGRHRGIQIDAGNNRSDLGDITISLGARVQGRDGTAIDIRRKYTPAGGNTKVILRTGGSIHAGNRVVFNHSGATLGLSADARDRGQARNRFDMGTLARWTGFTELEKSGSGRWTLAGAQPADKGFTAVDILAGTLRLEETGLVAGALTIAAGATFETSGTTAATTVTGNVTNNGTLTVFRDLNITGNLVAAAGSMIAMSTAGDRGADERLTIMGSFTTGGTLTMDIDLVPADEVGRSGRMGEDFYDWLTIDGSSVGTNMVSVVLNIRGNIADFDADGLVLVNFHDGTRSSNGAFTLNADDVAEGFALTRIASGAGEGDWMLTHTLTADRCFATDDTIVCSGDITATTSRRTNEHITMLDADPAAPATFNVTSGDAINIYADSYDNVDITLGGAVTATAGTGIEAHAEGGDVAIVTDGDISGRTGIHIDGYYYSSKGDWSVSIAGKVTGTSTSGHAVHFERNYAPAAGVDTRLIIRPGGQIAVGSTVASSHPGAVLNLDGDSETALVQAKLIVANALDFTALDIFPGTTGNDITIAVLAASGNAAPQVTATGSAVTIRLGSTVANNTIANILDIFHGTKAVGTLTDQIDLVAANIGAAGNNITLTVEAALSGNDGYPDISVAETADGFAITINVGNEADQNTVTNIIHLINNDEAAKALVRAAISDTGTHLNRITPSTMVHRLASGTDPLANLPVSVSLAADAVATNQISATQNATNLTGGAGDAVFNLGRLADFTNFDRFEKTGAEADDQWIVSGTMPADKAFSRVDVTSGILLLDGSDEKVTLRLAGIADDVAVAAGATLAISGDVEITIGNLNMSGGGTLALAMSDDDGTDETLKVADFITGGTMTMNVKLVENDTDLFDKLTVTGSVVGGSGDTIVDIVVEGNPEVDLDSGGLTLIDGVGAITGGAFTLSTADRLLGFSLTRNATNGDWVLTHRQPTNHTCSGGGGAFICAGNIATAQTLTAADGEILTILSDRTARFTEPLTLKMEAGARSRAIHISGDIQANNNQPTLTITNASIHPFEARFGREQNLATIVANAHDAVDATSTSTGAIRLTFTEGITQGGGRTAIKVTGAETNGGPLEVHVLGNQNFIGSFGGATAVSFAGGSSQKLVLEGSLATQGDITFSHSDALMEIRGRIALRNGTLDFSGGGTLALAHADDAGIDDVVWLTDFVAGGNITMNVNFDGPDQAGFTTDFIIIDDRGTGGTYDGKLRRHNGSQATVDLTWSGSVANIGTGIELVDFKGNTANSHAGALVLGTAPDDVALTRDSEGDWNLVLAGCHEYESPGGTFICGGDIVTPQTITVDGGETLAVTELAGTSFTNSTGYALSVRAEAETPATLTFADAFTFTAVELGPFGNAISVQVAKAGTEAMPAVSVSGDAITITLGSTAANNTLDNILAALAGSSDVTELVTVALATGASGSTQIDGAILAVNLAGGSIGQDNAMTLAGDISQSGAATAVNVANAGDNNLSLTFGGGIDQTGTGSALYVTATGAGDVGITVNEAVTTAGAAAATFQAHMGSGDISFAIGSGGGITAAGAGTGRHGITSRIDQAGLTSGAITITNEGDIIAPAGIGIRLEADTAGTFTYGDPGALTITNAGTISDSAAGVSATANSGEAIDILFRGGNAVAIANTGTISTTRGDNHAIAIDHRGFGGIDIDITGGMVSGHGQGIEASTDSSFGSDIHVLVSNATVATADGASGTAISFAGGSRQTLRLESGATVTGGVTFSRLDPRIEVAGSATLDGALDFSQAGGSGALALALDDDAGTDEVLTIADFTAGGTLTLNVDFGFQMNVAAFDRLKISGGIVRGGQDDDSVTTVDLVAEGSVAYIGSGITLVDFENTDTSKSPVGAFMLGEAPAGVELHHDTTTGDWILRAIGGTAPTPTDSCVESTVTGGTWTCSGTIRAATTLDAASSEALAVTDEHGTNFFVPTGTALTFKTESGASASNFSFGGNVEQDAKTAAGTAASVENEGANSLSITFDGDLKSDASALNIAGSSSGDVAVTINGSVSSADGPAVTIANPDSATATGAISLTIGASGRITAATEAVARNSSGAGISAPRLSAGALTITNHGRITASHGQGIILTAAATTLAYGANPGAITITNAGVISDGGAARSTRAKEAINILFKGSNTVTLANTGTIAVGNAGIGAVKIDHRGSGGIDIDITDGTVSSDAVAIEAIGAASGGGAIHIFVSGDPNIPDEDALVAGNEGVTSVIGGGGTAITFTGGSSQTLKLQDHAAIGGDVTFSRADAQVEVVGVAVLDGELDMSGGGTIALALSGDAGTDEEFAVTDFVAGGTLTMNVAFPAVDKSDQLRVTGSITRGGATNDSVATIDLTTSGSFIEIGENGAVLVDFAGLDAANNSAEGAFMLGMAPEGVKLIRNDDGDWVLIASGCHEEMGGTFLCAGHITETTTLDAASGEALVLQEAPFISFTSASDPALVVETADGALNSNITIAGAVTQTATDVAATVTNRGGNNLAVDFSGAVSQTGMTGNSAVLVAADYGTGETRVTFNNTVSVANADAATVSLFKTQETRPASGGNLALVIGGQGNISGTAAGTSGDAIANNGALAAGTLSITNYGSISAAHGRGIDLGVSMTTLAYGANPGALTITNQGDITTTTTGSGGEAVNIAFKGANHVVFASSAGTISTAAGDNSAVKIAHADSGDIDIDITGGTISGHGIGIEAIHEGVAGDGGTRAIDISVSGATTMVSGTGGTAIYFMRGASQRLRLADGATLMGGVTFSRNDADVEVAGTVKIMGQLDFSAGGAITLALAGDSGTDEELEIADFVAGGTLTMNVDFDASVTGEKSDLLKVGKVTRASDSVTTIELEHTGSISNLGDGIVLVQFTGANASDSVAGAFALGASAPAGLQIQRDTGTGNWRIFVPDGCHETSGGAFLCVGALNTPQVLEAASGEALTLTEVRSSFTANTGVPLTIRALAGALESDIAVSGDIAQTNTAASAMQAAYIDHEGGNTLTIAFAGELRANTTALTIGGSSTGDVAVTLSGLVTTTAGDSVVISNTDSNSSPGDASLVIAAGAGITAASATTNTTGAVGHGVRASFLSEGAISITNMGSILAAAGAGIHIQTNASGTYGDPGAVTIANAGTISDSDSDNSITATNKSAEGIFVSIKGASGISVSQSAGGITTTAGSNSAIKLEHTGSGGIDIDITGGTITAHGIGLEAIAPTSGGGAIEIAVSGATVAGGVGGVGNAVSFTGGASQTLALGDNAILTGDVTFSRTDPRVEVSGSATITGDLDFSAGGTLALALTGDTDADETLALTDFVAGGTLTLNANFNETDKVDLLRVTGSITRDSNSQTTIDLVSTGFIGNIGDGLTLVDFEGSDPAMSATGAFTLGAAPDGVELVRNAAGDWLLTIFGGCVKGSGSSFTCRGSIFETPADTTDLTGAVSFTDANPANPAGFDVLAGHAIDITTTNAATTLTVDLKGDIVARSTNRPAHGIHIVHRGSGAVSVTTGGDVTISATRNYGIHVTSHHADGDIIINAEGDVEGIHAAPQQADTDVTITISGAVTASHDHAVEIDRAVAPGSAAVAKLVMKTGASLQTGKTVSFGGDNGDSINGVLEWSAEDGEGEGMGENRFDLAELSRWGGSVRNFDKTGAGQWTLHGLQNTSRGVSISSLDVMGGTLLLDAVRLSFRENGDRLTAASGGVVAVSGAVETNRGGLSLAGGGTLNLAFGSDTGTDEEMDVVRFVAGGTLRLNVNFDGADQSDQLKVRGNIIRESNSQTTIDLVTAGDVTSLGEGTITLVDFTHATEANSAAGAFILGMAPAEVELHHDTDSGDWVLRMAAPPGCDESPGGTFVCRGAITTATTLTAATGESLRLTEESNASFASATATAALTLDFQAGARSSALTIAAAITQTGTGHAVDISHHSDDALTLTFNGDIAQTGSDGYAMYIEVADSGAADITLNGAVSNTADDALYFVGSGGTGDISIAIGAAGRITGPTTTPGGNALAAGTLTPGDITITNEGAITAATGDAISLKRFDGTRFYMTPGDITITNAGTIRGGTISNAALSGEAIDIQSRAAGNITIASTAGAISSGANRTTAIKVDHSGGGMIDIDITGGRVSGHGLAIETIGAATDGGAIDITLTGMETFVEGLNGTSVTFTGGSSQKLTLGDGVTLHGGVTFSRADPTIEISGSALVSGTLDLSAGGTLSMTGSDGAGTGESLQVTNFVAGGTLTLNVNFDAADKSDQLIVGLSPVGEITRSNGSSTLVNLEFTGEVATGIGDGITLIDFRSTTASDSAAGAFTLGTAPDGVELYRVPATGDWILRTDPGFVAANCMETATAGTWTCTGIASLTSDMPITITGAGSGSEALIVTDEAGFGLRTTGRNDDALTVTGGAGNTRVEVTLDGDITTTGQLASALTVTSTHSDVTITSRGTISAGDIGIYGSVSGAGDNLVIHAEGATTGYVGIHANSGAGTVAGGMNTVAISAAVSGTGTNANAIEFTAGDDATDNSANETLIIKTGGSIAAGDVEASGADATLALDATMGDAGEANNSFSLASLASFFGFGNFDKTGTGQWTLTGAMPDDMSTTSGVDESRRFATADVLGGTLLLDAATVKLAAADDNLTVASGAALAVSGASAITIGGLDLSAGGAIDLAHNDAGGDRLSVVDFVSGGTLKLNVVFVNNGADTIDTLAISGAVSGAATTTVELAISGSVGDIDGALTLITGPSDSGETAFTLAEANKDAGYFLTRNAGTGNWALTHTAPVGCLPDCAGAITMPQTRTADMGALSVMDADPSDPADFTVRAGNAITLETTPAATTLDLDLDGDIETTGTGTDGGNAVRVIHEGTGKATIVTDGAVNAEDGDEHFSGIGILVHTRYNPATDPTSGNDETSGGLSITANGAIGTSGDPVGKHGIVAAHSNQGPLSITTGTGAPIHAAHSGIRAFTTATTSSATINAQAPINAPLGIMAWHGGSGKLAITTAADADISAANGWGIGVSNTAGALDIETNGNIGTEMTPAVAGIVVTHSGSAEPLDVTVNAAIHARNPIHIHKIGDGDATITTGAGGSLHAERAAISFSNLGAGKTTITTNGTINSQGQGIKLATASGATTATITANANITTQNHAIIAIHRGTGPLSVTLHQDADIRVTSSGLGIHAFTADNSNTNPASSDTDLQGGMTITANGDINTPAQQIGSHGIMAGHYNQGDLTINASGDIAVGGNGIRATATNIAGNIIITLSGMIDSLMPDIHLPTAVSMTGGFRHELILHPAAAIAAGDRVTSDKADANLELTADMNETGTFSLASLADWTGFANFEKSGAGTWTLEHTQPADKAFSTANVMAGTLHLRDAVLELVAGTDLAIASATTLQTSGASAINTGGLDNSAGGTIALAISGDAGTDDRLTLANFTAGGTLAMNVDFDTSAADQLAITGAVSRGTAGTLQTTIDLATAGTLASFTGALTLVDVADNTIGADAFTLGAVTGTATASDLELNRDTTSGDWMLTAAPAPAPSPSPAPAPRRAPAAEPEPDDTPVASRAAAAPQPNPGVADKTGAGPDDIAFIPQSALPPTPAPPPSPYAPSAAPAAPDAVPTEPPRHCRLAASAASHACAADLSAELAGASATLELGATPFRMGQFDLATDFADLPGAFADLEKTGPGYWTLSGVQHADHAFANANIRAGMVRLSDALLRADNLSVSANARLEARGTNLLQGDLFNDGAISLADSDATDRFTIAGDFTSGGTLTLNADLDAGAADRLIIEGDAKRGADATIIHVRATGEAVARPDLALVSVRGETDANAFAAGSVRIGMSEYDFALEGGRLAAIDLGSVRDAAAANGDGRMMASVPTYQSYAAALTRLARMDTLAERMAGRHWMAARQHDSGIQGIWGSLPSERSTLQPAAAEYDISDNGTAFGVNVPVGGLLLGADAWIGQGEADTSSALGDGAMNADGYALALTGTFGNGSGGGFGASGFYADTRLQYAAFSTGLATTANGEHRQTLASGNDASALGASAEVGYAIPWGASARLVPQAQLSWSEARFDGFTDPTLARISLADGETLTARFGLGAERRLGALHLTAAADLFLPIDGETAVRIAEDTAVTDMSDPSLSLSGGLAWEWEELRALFAEISADWGGESGEYRSSIGVRIGF